MRELMGSPILTCALVGALCGLLWSKYGEAIVAFLLP
jgi:hypothetical protein